MEINISDGIQTVISISGRLDTLSAPDFEKAIAPVIAGDMKEVILDCTDLDYISSLGLRMFLTMQKAANAKQGQLSLKGIKADVKEIFDITGFSSIFRFE